MPPAEAAPARAEAAAADDIFDAVRLEEARVRFRELSRSVLGEAAEMLVPPTDPVQLLEAVEGFGRLLRERGSGSALLPRGSGRRSGAVRGGGPGGR